MAIKAGMGFILHEAFWDRSYRRRGRAGFGEIRDLDRKGIHIIDGERTQSTFILRTHFLYTNNMMLRGTRVFVTPFLGGGGEGDLLVLVVKDGVELAHEDVAEDPQGAVGAGDVEAHHGEEAGGTNLMAYWTVRVGLSGDGEGEVGEEASQSTVYSPATLRLAPTDSARDLTILVGPVRREVPESTMAEVEEA